MISFMRSIICLSVGKTLKKATTVSGLLGCAIVGSNSFNSMPASDDSSTVCITTANNLNPDEVRHNSGF